MKFKHKNWPKKYYKSRPNLAIWRYQTPSSGGCNTPNIIIEPTCGLGSFVKSCKSIWGTDCSYYGFDVNSQYIEKCNTNINGRSNCHFEVANFFQKNWKDLFLSYKKSKVLVVGNPPSEINEKEDEVLRFLTYAQAPSTQQLSLVFEKTEEYRTSGWTLTEKARLFFGFYKFCCLLIFFRFSAIFCLLFHQVILAVGLDKMILRA